MSDTINPAPDTVVFSGVFPIGDTDTMALPVQEIKTALDFYCGTLGFELLSRRDAGAVLKRDGATVGIAVNGKDPEQASCYFSVSDVDALRRELEVKGVELSPVRTDEHDGRRYRVFFAKEPYGVCFCFGQPD